MNGVIHPAEPIWADDVLLKPAEIRAGSMIETFGPRGPRRARVEKTVQGSGRGTVWLHGASGACIRCLHDERVAVYVAGRQRYRRAGKVQPGDFLCRYVGWTLTVDPVVAIRTFTENVPAVYLTLPAVSLLSEEGYLVRPS